ncbi:MAG TPA: NADP-dependent oxidoreductase [Solirubrobacteraceae bacterium]|nr:NADP-dependent oxidoreductase [Solirubrobacteraceae bacterium]
MRQTGGPEVLNLEDVDAPEPGEDEVLIRVHAVSVNPIDWKFRRGLYPKELPVVLGNDISGTVVSSRAAGYGEGDEVFGFTSSGGYAELATASAGGIAHKPAAITHEQAAAIPVGGLTAWQALFDHGSLEAGQSVLIAAAAGGVGHFAVQLAKRADARTIGIGSARNRDFVMGLGADEYIDYTKESVNDAVSDVDVAFDAVGGQSTEELLGAVRPGGVLVTIANAAPEQQAQARGVRAVLFSMTPKPEQLEQIAGIVADGELHVELAETLPLAEVRRAHELSESGHTRGKIVLTLDS